MNEWNGFVAGSQDVGEGLRALREKRKPNFQNK